MSLYSLGKKYAQQYYSTITSSQKYEVIAHITSELGEVFECLRKDQIKTEYSFNPKDPAVSKPEGLGPELADVIILASKLAAMHDIDIDKMIELKHNYNQTRLRS